MKELTFGSLFAGIGGFDLGFERAGLKCKWQVEIDEYCRRVLAKHWPNVRRHDDVRTFPPDTKERCKCGGGWRFYDIGFDDGFQCSACKRIIEAHEHQRLDRIDQWSVDIICGGFPCVDISYAAVDRPGLEGERSGLFYEAMRIVRLLRPKYVVLENVPAMLDRWLGTVLRSLAECGLDAEWRCYRASQFGAPHIRDRLFVLGYRRELCGTLPATGHILADAGSESRWLQLPRGQSNPAQLLANGPDVSRDGQAIVYHQGEAHTDVGSWTSEPTVRRVGYGLSNWMDRRRCLGNAVCPDIAEWIGRRILEA